MTPTPIDDYLDRLRRALARWGYEDARLLAEAREHLADAIDEGLQRGLSAEDAARQAFARFGPPELVARSIIQEKRDVWTRLAAAGDLLWRWKWWLIAPTLVMAVGTSVFSSYFLPPVYRSELVIRVVPVPGATDRRAQSNNVPEHLHRVAEATLTGQKLEALIRDFGLYSNERTNEPLGNLATRMRRDIGIVLTGDAADEFLVSFQAPDPKLAMRTTERLASLFIQQNLFEAERTADDPRSGFQFKIMGPARLPDRPVWSSHLGVNAVGTLAGLGLGLLLVGMRGRSTASIMNR